MATADGSLSHMPFAETSNYFDVAEDYDHFAPAANEERDSWRTLEGLDDSAGLDEEDRLLMNHMLRKTSVNGGMSGVADGNSVSKRRRMGLSSATVLEALRTERLMAGMGGNRTLWPMPKQPYSAASAMPKRFLAAAIISLKRGLSRIESRSGSASA